MGELSGKTALVTGSGRGLGRVMAERLAELGANVAIHDLDPLQPARYGEFADIDEVARLTGQARHPGGDRDRQHRRSRRRWRG